MRYVKYWDKISRVVGDVFYVCRKSIVGNIRSIRTERRQLIVWLFISKLFIVITAEDCIL